MTRHKTLTQKEAAARRPGASPLAVRRGGRAASGPQPAPVIAPWPADLAAQTATPVRAAGLDVTLVSNGFSSPEAVARLATFADAPAPKADIAANYRRAMRAEFAAEPATADTPSARHQGAARAYRRVVATMFPGLASRGDHS